MFEKIAFIHYCTENIDRTLKFYSDVMGFKLLVQNDEWVEFAIGDQRLALHLVKLMPLMPEGSHPNGAMVWLYAKPIEQAIAHLEGNNIKFINKLEEFSYGKTATFTDPDGNLLGLYEPPEK